MSGTKTPDSTGKSPDRRKLIAVLYADMVGYSRLIGLDDVGTLERLRALRREVIDPAIAEHGGRIVNTGGDSLLIVFDSVDGAVRCAMMVQERVSTHDGDQPPDRTIRFRVGINVGDVIPDGTDVHGDVVNVAARLQAECPPGGICVSRAVRDHVQDRLGLAFEEFGPLKLKNITRPVEAFVLRLETAKVTPTAVHQSPMRITHEALTLPDKPSIAVLPFANMGNNPDQEYFSDGVSEDIITELSRNRSLFVIARNSSFSYKGRSMHVTQVAHELGVRYVLEGSVRRSENRVRISAQLIDAQMGNHIWAERYDRDLIDVFAVQDEITQAVAIEITPAISQAERVRALQKPTANLSAWEAYHRGLWHASRGNNVDFDLGADFFHRAVALDPLFAEPHASLARLYLSQATRGGGRSLHEALALAEPEARAAQRLDDANSSAHAALAWVFDLRGDAAPALEQADRAIALNPNDPAGYAAKGHILVFARRAAEARLALNIALRLDPLGETALTALHHLTVISYLEGDYADSEVAARRVIRAYPHFPRSYPYLVASLGQLGRANEADRALREAMSAAPDFFQHLVRGRPPYYRPDDYDRLLDGLRKAGWQG
jgi:adenylate cyclase